MFNKSRISKLTITNFMQGGSILSYAITQDPCLTVC